MINNDIISKIHYFHNSEGLSAGEIAKLLGCHHSTVKKALKSKDNNKGEVGQLNGEGRPFPKILSEHKEIIEKIIDKNPKIKSVSLLDILEKKGIKASATTLRRAIVAIKGLKTKKPTPYSLRQTDIGDEAQVDWGDLKIIDFLGFRRRVYLFVIVLSWSRDIFAKASFDMEGDTFARAHVHAFSHFGGVPNYCLYDNLKSVVKKNEEQTLEFNEKFLSFAGNYKFKIRACNVRRPQEKGRVERAIRYIKESFMPARSFINLEDFNSQLFKWLEKRTRSRQWPEDKNFTVEEKVIEESEKLINLPATLWFPKGRVLCRVRKNPYFQLKKNMYSVPCDYVGQLVEVFYDDDTVEAWFEKKLIAMHKRSYQENQVIEDLEHTLELAKKQGKGSHETRKNALIRIIPSLKQFFEEKKRRQENTRRYIPRLTGLHDMYGKDELSKAVELTMNSGSYAIEAIENYLRASKNETKRIPNNLIRKDLRKVKTIHQDLSKYNNEGSENNVNK